MAPPDAQSLGLLPPSQQDFSNPNPTASMQKSGTFAIRALFYAHRKAPFAPVSVNRLSARPSAHPRAPSPAEQQSKTLRSKSPRVPRSPAASPSVASFSPAAIHAAAS